MHFHQLFKCFAGIGVVSGWGMITGEHTSFVFVFAFHLKMGWTHSFLDGVYLHSILGKNVFFESQLQKKFWKIGMPLTIIIKHKIFNTSSYLYIIKLQEKKLYKGKERKYTQMLTYKWHSWWLHGNKKLCLTAANCSDLALTFTINKTTLLGCKYSCFRVD